jgi:hypothetical protein
MPPGETFAMNEENVGHTNSPTLLHVEVGSLSTTFHLGTSLAPLAQTFATVNGGQYVLTFAMNEENVGHTNSPTLLHVEVGSLSTTFHLDTTPGGHPGNNGYIIYSANFTATSASTTLRFWDVTPGSSPFDSAFVDDVSVESAQQSVPVPGALVLLASAGPFAMVLGIRRSRRPDNRVNG